jgi:ATP-dependent RNA helicase DDX46/PRP5
MHGGVDQYDRENAINDFKAGVKTIMIATSVCSRGLDVKDLKVGILFFFSFRKIW